ncbi:MAG: PmoA family protein [Planctomycetota bacterium]
MRKSPALALLFAACAAPGPGTPVASRLQFAPLSVGIAVHDGPEPFAEYRTDGQRGPVLWPLCAPGGATLTRAFPFAEIDGEAHDHPHHESCWFAHGSVGGVDFWQGQGRIAPVGPPRVDAAHAVIEQALEWRDHDDRLVCREQRTYRFGCGGQERWVDVAVRLGRDPSELVIGDTKEGTMALRLRPEFCLDGPGAAGAIHDSEGRTDHDVWGKRARWVAYSAVVDGVPRVVAMFDQPQNHGYPTHWHARGYGLFAANPFGLSDFEKAPKGSGGLRLPAGATLSLHYRIWIHNGPFDAAAVEAAWREFAAAN